MPMSSAPVKPKYYVYVIRLLESVLEEEDFAAANPNHRADKPCVYVGSSIHPPMKRYEQHVVGYKACRKVTKHHNARYPLIERKQRIFRSRPAAESHERWLAQDLRARGYAVWQK